MLLAMQFGRVLLLMFLTILLYKCLSLCPSGRFDTVANETDEGRRKVEPIGLLGNQERERSGRRFHVDTLLCGQQIAEIMPGPPSALGRAVRLRSGDLHDVEIHYGYPPLSGNENGETTPRAKNVTTNWFPMLWMDKAGLVLVPGLDLESSIGKCAAELQADLHHLFASASVSPLGGLSYKGIDDEHEATHGPVRLKFESDSLFVYHKEEPRPGGDVDLLVSLRERDYIDCPSQELWEKV